MRLKPARSERERQARYRGLEYFTVIANMPDEELAALPEHARRRYIHRLSPLNYPDKVMKRLLRSEAYPSSIAARDVALTKAFFEAWKASPQADRKNTASPRKIFLSNCWLAATILGLDKDMTIRTMLTSFGERTPEARADQVFEGAVAVHHILHDGKSHVILHLNKDGGIWTNPFLAPQAADNAAMALHELTHVEQDLQYQNKKGPAFYADMKFQIGKLNPQAFRYDTYRNTLVERQSHYRQQIFMRLHHGAPLSTEQECLKQDDLNRFVQQQPPDFFAKLLRGSLEAERALAQIIGDEDDVPTGPKEGPA